MLSSISVPRSFEDYMIYLNTGDTMIGALDLWF